MALQQVIPDFSPAVGLGVEKIVPLKKMLRPVEVAFRRGGSLSALVAAVDANRSVAVNASAGAGKSTLVPGAIVDSLGGLLIHVLPSGFLAKELWEYVSKARKDCDLVMAADQDWPSSGWVFTSAAVLQAKFLASGELRLPECIVYHDEVHRSDAWTYLLAHQWGNIAGLKKYVTATATGGTSGFRVLESDGQVQMKTFDSARSAEKWDVFDRSGLPWSVDSIVGNTLIFEDRNEHATHLVREYSRVGYDVYRLHSRMKMGVFEAAVSSLKSSSITILIADSTFRDGYTFDLATVIDSGVVETTRVINHVPSRASRSAYEGEIYQAAARGGRTAGSSVVVWRPDAVFERKRVTLEEVEMDAVALVSRMLSTLPPLEVSDSLLAEGKVPRDLTKALQSAQPLACLADTQLALLGASGYRRSPSPVLREGVDVTTKGVDYYHIGVSADRTNRMEDLVRTPVPELARAPEPSVGSGDSYRTASAASTGATDWSDVAGWAAEAASKDLQFECRKYYYSPSVDLKQFASVEFPDGWNSVVRVFGADRSTLAVQDLCYEARNVAIAAGFQRFNLLSCEANAVANVVRDVSALGRGRAAPLMNTWIQHMLERNTALNVECNSIARIMTTLMSGYCELAELPPSCLDVQCKALASRMFEELRGIPANVVSMEDAMSAVAASVAMPEEEPIPRAPLVYGVGDQRYAEMATRGKASRPRSGAHVSFNKWVLGYAHNPGSRRKLDRIM